MKTPDTINGKTPEEIKKGLKCRKNGYAETCNRNCQDCALFIPKYSISERYADAIAYIQQLESSLAQAERERDAAVRDINFYQSAVCFTCSNQIPPEEREDWRTYCKKYGRLPEVISDKRLTFCSDYNWRGVCEENTKGGPECL